MKRLPKETCDHCQGSGMVANFRACGLWVRRAREEAGISLRALAAKLKISPSYLSDLELGKRGSEYWNQDKLDAAIDAIKRCRL
jgi:ribosome-binding protein aMBF1 (putative translation factor)